MYEGDTNKALVEFSKIISSSGEVLPATLGDVNIWAQTTDGKKVVGEQNIDLGNYNTKVKTLKKVFLNPPDVKAYEPALAAINAADAIIVGPGDLFSTVLPVLIVPQIKKAFLKSKALKIFLINVANKPFETTHFKVSDYLKALKDH
ncbi:YvcK family protein, partial [Candidatus Curtissbacteria bacterium]|nr:YvcK family protein [Candidatus Curtissbacteria bacterium]